MHYPTNSRCGNLLLRNLGNRVFYRVIHGLYTIHKGREGEFIGVTEIRKKQIVLFSDLSPKRVFFVDKSGIKLF